MVIHSLYTAYNLHAFKYSDIIKAYKKIEISYRFERRISF